MARSGMFHPSSAIGWGPGPSAVSAQNPRLGRTASMKPESYCESAGQAQMNSQMPVCPEWRGAHLTARRSQTMRKNVQFFLGAAAGASLTLLVAAPQGALSGAVSKAAAAADTYSQLNLFGEVFERVRASYVEKPDDTKLVEGAINGMVTSLDP